MYKEKRKDDRKNKSLGIDKHNGNKNPLKFIIIFLISIKFKISNL